MAEHVLTLHVSGKEWNDIEKSVVSLVRQYCAAPNRGRNSWSREFVMEEKVTSVKVHLDVHDLDAPWKADVEVIV